MVLLHKLVLTLGVTYSSISSCSAADWVYRQYLANSYTANPSDAQRTIIQAAKIYTERGGPWTIVRKDSNQPLPPSGNPHDYLSWAPYHWPQCDWCPSGSGRSHLSKGNDTNSDPNNDADGDEDFDPDDPYIESLDITTPSRMIKRRKREETSASTASDRPNQALLELPSPSLTLSPVIPTEPTRTTHSSSVTHSPAMAPAKSPTKCTPSPTKSLEPSATWCACKYIRRDGKVNPDVRELSGPAVIGNTARAIEYNGAAFTITRKTAYLDTIFTILNQFFIQKSTSINPNVDYGQIVRGPDGKCQRGTFTGVLDMHVLVSVANIGSLLGTLKPEKWDVIDKGVKQWTTGYVNWLGSSKIALSAQEKPNNHGTFFAAQKAALLIYLGRHEEAKKTLDDYYTKIFPDQIATNGEQPFEASRTRPNHYRSYNIEAMITTAKLGDQLGQNYWIRRSKNGATIQNAVDFTMGKCSEGNETKDIDELLPHVAAIAAAYGDPSGKYERFLSQNDASFKKKPYFFYNQPGAFPNSKRRAQQQALAEFVAAPIDDGFTCPLAFLDEETIEVDNGVYLTCAMVRGFYGAT